MRVPALCLASALFLGSPVYADDAASVSPADRQAIERVITSQLDAFAHDAADAAFGFASPSIQSMFGDAPHFMAMVQQAYPPVHRPRSFTFEQLETVDQRIVQRVLIIGPDSTPALALYTMEREPDGTWRIDGCSLTRPPGLTT